MNKRKFFSIKYRKTILPEDKNFWTIARDEAIYRLDEKLVPLAPLSGALRDKKMNYSCLEHMEKREEPEKFLKRFKIKK